MRVYVASSWRNPTHPEVVERLRGAGHEVYDFRNPPNPVGAFSWSEIDDRAPRTVVGSPKVEIPAEDIVRMLAHPRAQDGFESDMGALQWCDACVLVLPCGRSAHLEAGWAAGAGKHTVALITDGEPDLMWKMLGTLCTTLDQVMEALVEREPWNGWCGGVYGRRHRYAHVPGTDSIDRCACGEEIGK